ncbi:MAG: hypothetical protein EOM20_14085 [Spartobacteria bacterium]|nr:hypothetical protein [Spartobacteria bacterium]
MREKPHIRILWLAAVLIIAAALLNLAAARAAPLSSLFIAVPYYLCALFLTLVIIIRVSLLAKAEAERQARKIARAEQAENTLFDAVDEESEPFSYQRSARQFERFGALLIAPALCLIQGFFVWRFFGRTPVEIPPAAASYLPSTALFAAEAFVFFLLSRYLLGLSRIEADRLLRGPGIYTGLLSLSSLICMAAALGQHIGVPLVNRVGGWILVVALAALALENLFRSIAQGYRPFIADARNTSYESRLGRLLTDPGAWVHNLSEALDYQFGFNISRTWFYRFLAQALLPLLIFQLLALYGLSCLVFLAPEEQGILERLGRPVPATAGGLLESGFHLTWPWPFETVRRFPAKRIQTQHIGFESVVTNTPEYMLWTLPHHAKRELFLTASREQYEEANTSGAVPVNFLSMHIPIQYRITNVYAYAYNCATPDRVLRDVAYRTLTRQAVQYGLNDFLSGGRQDLSARMRGQIQAAADERGLGLAIEFVGLQGVHPPLGVAVAFESVVGAIEEREAIARRARAYCENVLPMAAANAASTVMFAQAETVRKIAMAEAEAYAFEQRLKGYREAPHVFEKDVYLHTVQRALSAPRKYIVATDARNEIIMFDLKDKLNTDLFDFGSDALEGMSHEE